MSPEAIVKILNENTEERQFGILGEPRINVLKINLALDALKTQ
ncbi:potassium-transporting ATPase subunit C [Salmonella enterica]